MSSSQTPFSYAVPGGPRRRADQWKRLLSERGEMCRMHGLAVVGVLSEVDEEGVSEREESSRRRRFVAEAVGKEEGGMIGGRRWAIGESTGVGFHVTVGRGEADVAMADGGTGA